jgi:hypothetical protein
MVLGAPDWLSIASLQRSTHVHGLDAAALRGGQSIACATHLPYSARDPEAYPYS